MFFAKSANSKSASMHLNLQPLWLRVGEMELEANIIIILVIGSVVGVQFQFYQGESLIDLIKNIIWGQAISLWVVSIYKLAILPIVDYFEKKQPRKDIKDLWSIAHDFLPRETYVKFRIEKHGKTIEQMYNSYFAILIWIWVEHLKKKKKNHYTFINVAEENYYEATMLYRSLSDDIEHAFLLISFEEICTLSCPGAREDYIRHLTYATHWAAKRLVGEGDNEVALAKEFAGHVIEFMKANDL